MVKGAFLVRSVVFCCVGAGIREVAGEPVDSEPELRFRKWFSICAAKASFDSRRAASFFVKNSLLLVAGDKNARLFVRVPGPSSLSLFVLPSRPRSVMLIVSGGFGDNGSGSN